jgi:hypothetical protein
LVVTKVVQSVDGPGGFGPGRVEVEPGGGVGGVGPVELDGPVGLVELDGPVGPVGLVELDGPVGLVVLVVSGPVGTVEGVVTVTVMICVKTVVMVVVMVVDAGPGMVTTKVLVISWVRVVCRKTVVGTVVGTVVITVVTPPPSGPVGTVELLLVLVRVDVPVVEDVVVTFPIASLQSCGLRASGQHQVLSSQE